MMKFKLYLFSAILAVMPFISGGCSNKNVSYEDAGTVWSGLFSNHDSKTVRKTLSLKNFHGINVVSAAQVYYTQGSEYKVEFEGRSCDFNNLSFKVSDGILVVGFSKKNNWKRHRLAQLQTLYHGSAHRPHSMQRLVLVQGKNSEDRQSDRKQQRRTQAVC